MYSTAFFQDAGQWQGATTPSHATLRVMNYVRYLALYHKIGFVLDDLAPL